MARPVHHGQYLHGSASVGFMAHVVGQQRAQILLVHAVLFYAFPMPREQGGIRIHLR